MTTVFEALKKKITGRQVTRRHSLKDLRAQMADGKKIDQESAADLLEQLDMSPDELAAQVELLKERRTWAVEIKAGQKADSEYVAIREQIEKQEAELEQLIEKFQAEKIAPLQDRREAASQAISAGTRAETRLRETSKDPEALEAMAGIQEEMEAMRVRKASAEHEFNDCERWIQTVKTSGTKASTHDKDRLPAKEKELEGLQDICDAFHAEAEELNTRYVQTQAGLLEPNAI